MKSKGKRVIQDGRKYDKFFPVADGKTTSVKNDANVEDTLKELKNIVRSTLDQTKKIAKELQGNNTYETCRNIWNWVYNHIQYKEDEKFIEQLREPARLWNDKEGDCDCYTIMISSILMNLGIPHILRITKYKKKFPQVPHWQHIYPVVPKDKNLKADYSYYRNRKDYIVIDCVTDKFDYEVPYLEKKDYDMQLARLSGLDGVMDEESDNEPTIVNQRELADGVLVGIDENNQAWIQTHDEEEGISGWQPYEPGAIEGLGKKSKAEKKAFKKERRDWRKEKREVKKATKGKPKAERKAARQELRVRKPLTKTGKALRKISKVINKANPLTVLIRNGILASMKINMKGLGNKYRYAYMTDQQALARGMDLNALKKLRNEVTLRERAFEMMGGEKKNLKNAILKGKGNRKDPVLGGISLLGLYSTDDIYETVNGYEDQFNGLGEVATAATGASLAAAAATVVSWASSMKKNVTGLFPKDKEKQKEFDSEPTAAEDAQNLNAEAESFAPGATPVTPQQLQAITQGVRSGKIDPNKLAKDATGEDINTTGDEQSSWVKPALIVAGVAGLGLLGYTLMKNKNTPKVQPSEKPMNGVKKYTPRKRKAPKKQKITIVNL